MTATRTAEATRQSLTSFLPLRNADEARVAFGSDPALWLPQPALPAGDGHWVIRLIAGLTSHAAVCTVGAVSQHAGALWRELEWQASDPAGNVRARDRAFPHFAGELGLITTPAATLVVSGGYDPPGGGVGAALDRAGLERIADMSGRRFLADVATGLRASIESTAEV